MFWNLSRYRVLYHRALQSGGYNWQTHSNRQLYEELPPQKLEGEEGNESQ